VAVNDEEMKIFDEFVQRARDLETVADFADLSAAFQEPPYTDLVDREDAACFALQHIADQNNIDVDLTCEG
jgi:hypothetical protein